MRGVIFGGILISLLGACSGGWEETNRKGAQVVADGVSVKWAVERKLGRTDDGTRHAHFSFFRAYGDEVHLSYLTLPQRAALAHRVVHAHPRCHWVGFDPDFNDENLRGIGSQSDDLLAQVRC